MTDWRAAIVVCLALAACGAACRRPPAAAHGPDAAVAPAAEVAGAAEGAAEGRNGAASGSGDVAPAAADGGLPATDAAPPPAPAGDAGVPDASGGADAARRAEDEETRLPAARPADFRVSYASLGYRNASGEFLDVSAEGCTYRMRYFEGEASFAFSLGAEDLDALYAVFRRNRFDRIGTYEEIVLDAGGDSIGIDVGPDSYLVADGSHQHVAPAWRPRWQAILAALGEIIAREREARAKEITVVVGRSLAGETGSVDLDGTRIWPATGAAEIPREGVSATARCLPGTHLLDAHVRQGAVGGRQVIDCAAASRFRLELRGEQIEITPRAREGEGR